MVKKVVKSSISMLKIASLRKAVQILAVQMALIKLKGGEFSAASVVTLFRLNNLFKCLSSTLSTFL